MGRRVIANQMRVTAALALLPTAIAVMVHDAPLNISWQRELPRHARQTSNVCTDGMQAERVAPTSGDNGSADGLMFIIGNINSAV